jgi:hypothetical protein
MTNNPFLRAQALRKADESSIPGVCAEAFADTVGEPNRATARYKKFRESTLGGKGSQRSKISAKSPEEHLAPAPVQDGNTPALAMSGDDFYRAACVDAHARLLNCH